MTDMNISPTIETLKQDALSCLRQLIAIPSVSRDETAAADCLQAHMETWQLHRQREANNLYLIDPDYAERRAITDMRRTGKPYLVVVNSRNPEAQAAQDTARYIREQFGIEPMVLDAQTLDTAGISRMLRALLYTFPMTELRVYLPRWLDALEKSHPVKEGLYQALLRQAGEIQNLGQAQDALAPLEELPEVQSYTLRGIDLAEGTVSVAIALPETLYYEILSSKAGVPIESDAELLGLLMELAKIKQEYDKISDALASVKATGYGVVMPAAGEMQLEKPEVINTILQVGDALHTHTEGVARINVGVDAAGSEVVRVNHAAAHGGRILNQ